MNILVTGGCGYTGSILVNSLLKDKHKVTVVDTMWFGNYLKKNKNLKIIKLDIRNYEKIPLKNISTVIHLANIANDPSVELNPTLSWEVNVLATQKLIELCIENKVKQFIYASSGSVYGFKKEKKVTEDLSLVPISVYNKTKMIAERVLMSYSNKIKVHMIRPATVCGYSPRMRFDVSVNMLTLQALTKKKITVFGGSQIRPNIHILDLINVYKHFLKYKKLASGAYNAGFENISIINLAKKIQSIIPCKITIKKNNNDKRSYRQNSDKLLSTSFEKKFKVEDAIIDIKNKYFNNSLKILPSSYTVSWMKTKRIK
ncbi:SDR family oxidoreductase [Candidatus Pelagibacter sp.]|uniref:SDR family oxidoreductase n=1 Tax=Candidatus Pelagibacter sp. TaxID=2024849 RepID=UPI003F87090C